MKYKIRQYAKLKNFDSFILGADIGGTNTNLAIAGINKNKQKLVLSFDYKTKSLPNLESALNNCLETCKKNYNIEITKACLGIAGPVQKEVYCKPTFINWEVKLENILDKTPLEKVKLINDFVALGYSINVLPDKEIKKFNFVKPEKYAVKAIIGAGTGLGKTILYYNKNCYIPLPSEGGHMDLPIKNMEELKIFEDVKKISGDNLSLIHILSGQGINYVYDVMKKKHNLSKFSSKIDKAEDKASMISKFRKQDKACKETFEIFTKFYGRACKNLSLTSLCFGGLYIGGGIAVKNQDIFESKIFWEEFFSSSMDNVLKKIPVYLIKTYDSGIKGALFAASIL